MASPRSVAGPRTGQPGESPRAGAVDRRLGRGEDRALDGRGQHHLAHRVLALERPGCVVLLGHPLPDLLEQRPRDDTRQDAAQQADRAVRQLRSLAHRLLLATRFLRKITRPTTTPARARAAAIT